MANEKKVVAWQVTDPHEGNATIAFHHHGLAARRIGADDLDMESEGMECKRAPEYNKFAEAGVVPTIALLENGWWFECHHCGNRVEEDGENSLRTVVIDGHRTVYCDKSCKDAKDTEVARRNTLFKEFKNRLKSARPDLEFTSFTGGYPCITMTAKFMFDGAKYGGTARDDGGELTWFVAGGDQDAWAAYKADRETHQPNRE